MNNKNEKLEARRPRGFIDWDAASVRRRRKLLHTVLEVYERYGFAPLDTSIVEHASVLGEFLPDEDMPHGGVFVLEGEEGLALRYDLTAALARHVAEHQPALPFRRVQWGEVFRNEKTGPGRWRQFMQVDADTVGAESLAADVENCLLLQEALTVAGAEGVRVRVNHRMVLEGVLEKAGVRGDAERVRALRAMDKLDRLGEEGVRALLGEGRKDASGDVTVGAGLGAQEVERVMAFVGSGGGESREEVLEVMLGVVRGSEVGEEGVRQLAEMSRLLEAGGAGLGVVYDPSIVRGLGYYTGAVYEAEVTGGGVVEGSVAGGGRYDNLLERFGRGSLPATGVSVGLGRLDAVLAARSVAVEGSLVVVLATDEEGGEARQRLVRELRSGGVQAEIYVGGGGMGKQFRYADKRGARLVLVEGEDERARGEVAVKDLALGRELSSEVADNKTWREQRTAQEWVPRDEVVRRVQALLGEKPQ